MIRMLMMLVLVTLMRDQELFTQQQGSTLTSSHQDTPTLPYTIMHRQALLLSAVLIRGIHHTLDIGITYD